MTIFSRLGRVLLLSASLFTACDPTLVPDSGLRSTPAPGGGVCCPIELREGCSPGFGLVGGWAPSGAACARGGGLDGCPFTLATDARGCGVVRSAAFCPLPCGAVRWDAGAENLGDANVDAGPDRTSDGRTNDDAATDPGVDGTTPG